LTRRRNRREDDNKARFRLFRIVVALCCAAALAAPLAGCAGCSDWPWSATQKTCHDENAR
jgi:hypothetical protein